MKLKAYEVHHHQDETFCGGCGRPIRVGDLVLYPVHSVEGFHPLDGFCTSSCAHSKAQSIRVKRNRYRSANKTTRKEVAA